MAVRVKLPDGGDFFPAFFADPIYNQRALFCGRESAFRASSRMTILFFYSPVDKLADDGAPSLLRTEKEGSGMRY